MGKWKKLLDGGITSPTGYLAGAVAAGIKASGQPDLVLLVSDRPATAAGLFTTNKVKAAPVLVSQEHLQSRRARAVIINAGNANACNGAQGMRDAREMAEQVSTSLGIPSEQVLVASTGIIGVPLPMDRVRNGIGQAIRELNSHGGAAAARGIMTTDTRPKEIALNIQLDGWSCTIGGTCKGSGMIHPNMATMLAVLTTDASIEPYALDRALRMAANASFNCVTVDRDTSTNDSLFLLANGQGTPLTEADPHFAVFCQGLQEVCVYLAKEIARDGEGATKLLEIQVTRAVSVEQAKQAAMSVATSPLVKTAFFGEDPNLGRIACAVGYAGVEMDPEHMTIALGDEVVFTGGGAVAFDMDRVKAVLAAPEIRVIIDLDCGEGTATVWTCDFSFEYVEINGHYHT